MIDSMFQAMLKHGLKLSLKKFQLFQIELVNTGFLFTIQNQGMTTPSQIKATNHTKDFSSKEC